MKKLITLLLGITLFISCSSDNEQEIDKSKENPSYLIKNLKNNLSNKGFNEVILFDWEKPVIDYNTKKEIYIIEIETKVKEKNKISKLLFNFENDSLISQLWELSFNDLNKKIDDLHNLKVHEILVEFSGTIKVYDIDTKLSKELIIDSPVLKKSSHNLKYSTRAGINHGQLGNSSCALCHRQLNEITITTPGSGFGDEFGIGIIPVRPGTGPSTPINPPTPNVPEKINFDKKFADNNCIMAIYNKLGGVDMAKRYLKAFDNQLKAPDLTWKLDAIDSGSNTIIYGQTDPLGFYNYEITINENYINYPLEIAGTMLHELIHATLMRWQHSSPNLGFAEKNFPGIYDFYKRYGPSSNDYQHNLMANAYVDLMIKALKQYDNSYDNSVYEAIAWSGLKGTTDYNNLSSKKKKEIENNLKEYKNEKNKINCK
ncbi:hypothetical protein HX063_17230 [Myroides odoratimimus]|uniref:hypothetical protein n=1 Tax=Myroides odoratimimus TaxID=76832 RepID=UPI002574B770|nr:hypothetical protein [Myroides odoratimimus]MDM1497114.1 hypothetical protein [Myroides odoratimimus]